MSSAAPLKILALLGGVLCLVHVNHALFGGQDATPLQFPSQVFIRGFNSSPLRLFSTGVLIHPEWVLTSAESVAGYAGILVTLGVVKQDSQDPQRQDISVIRRYLHPGWKGTTPYTDAVIHDIALIQLSRPAQLSDAVKVASLPRKEAKSGAKATVSGWGLHKTDFGIRNQNELKWIETKTIGLLACNWKRMSVWDITGRVKQTHICADTRGLGPCQNDGGAPLIGGKIDVPVVYGIFTAPNIYNEYCGKDIPSVFTRVSSYVTWIASVSGVSPQ